jgi:hypothetical protein
MSDDDIDEDFDEEFGDLPAPAPAFGAVDVPEGYRSGFACFVGRPNAGKSTLTNALVGQKIVITSDKPQTTRTVVRGIVHRPDGQLVLVDTPGLHRPRTLLRPVHRQRAGEGPPYDEDRRRHQDRPRLPAADRRAPPGHRRARRGDEDRVGRDRPGLVGGR